ncbi:precorrin-6y C5,15-methyltransferase (decarboxylating) subunit CbiE [Alicyclobacillus sp. ALC3]|uniref:precorrin-6y C5,15-methyltransferase (decarboxylating) subunit CbiE n=1 Tax=Alicyclobacillus sp. ALC3 TaxID=2796143 RepID=UPI002378F50E|nr:precorrin-6y C5,15-methyltransferase (decarboxylating) subunit CbiE [Alicyclobacillus sp. ALC3]WDL96523.1 precorrin-6y C5,15-methyltransferase (decarboxylating) subunit CbiE [Alicyclobacillus sp. ALC3]
MPSEVIVVGIGDDGAVGLMGDARTLVEQADLLVGGERQLNFFPNYIGEQRVIKGKLTALLDDLQDLPDTQSVVVLASGDPLFYGIGSLLIKRLGRERVRIIPHLSSVQLAFARCGESWQDASVISLHGRPIAGLAQRIGNAQTVALLTDADNSPARIARYLLDFDMTEYAMFVAENLGGPTERTGRYSLQAAAGVEFAPLNVVILLRNEDAPAAWPLGIEDSEFSQRKPDRGLITKKEIRVLSLAELALRPGDVLWDIGACTGSVSIEAVLHTPGLQAFAIEKNEGDLENLRENQVKFRTDFVAVHGKAPAGLEGFPDPDAVFVGGSGGELAELLQVCAKRMRPRGRIVINAATLETLTTASQTLKQLGFEVAIALVQTARSKPILNLTRFEGMNPVYIVTARHGNEGDEKSDE